MTKVVYNACFGGFGISEAGMRRYCEIRGIPCWIVPDAKMASLGLYTCWIVPPEERIQPLDGAAFYEASMEERQANRKAYSVQMISYRDIARHDQALVQMVEELGDKANGQFAKLRIDEVPNSTPYRIDEYDGNESVCTAESYDWISP